jgi:hypothetical protein
MNIDTLARDYFAKQEVYRALVNKRITDSPTDLAERAALEIAERNALDELTDASMALDKARRGEGSYRMAPHEHSGYEIGSGGPL